MLYVYPAIFHHEDDSYWVEFPDLEGCQTFGESLPETKIKNSRPSRSRSGLTIQQKAVIMKL